MSTRNSSCICRVVVICLFALSPVRLSAQIADLITDYVAGYISDYVTQQFNSYVNSSWDEIISQGAIDAIIEKAGELKNFEITKDGMTDLLQKSPYSHNGDINVAALFNTIPTTVKTEFYKNTHSMKNVPFSALGAGFMNARSVAYIDSINRKNSISSLEDVLSQQLLDSISCFTELDLTSSIKSDLDENRRLILLFNNHPEIVRIYANSFNSVLRKDTRHLLYWATCADSIYGNLSKKNKKKFVKANTLLFDNNKVLYNGQTIAQYDLYRSTFVMKDVNLLNFYPKGNSMYKVYDTVYKTDVLGRVVEIEFNLSQEKAKKVKTPIKFKHFCKAIDVKNGKNFYSEVLEKYRIAPSLAFAIPIDLDKEEKAKIKLFHKMLKKKLKEQKNLIVNIKLEYGNTVLRKPISIKATYGGETMNLYK